MSYEQEARVYSYVGRGKPFLVLEVPNPAEGTHRLEILVERVIIRYYHAPFDGRYVMRKEKAECSHMAECAHFLSLDFSSRRLAGIFDKVQVMGFSNFLNASYLTRSSEKMDRDNGLRFRPNRFLDLLRYEIECSRVHINEDRG